MQKCMKFAAKFSKKSVFYVSTKMLVECFIHRKKWNARETGEIYPPAWMASTEVANLTERKHLS